jgi:hypothetical protein
MRARGILAAIVLAAVAVNGLAGCGKKLHPIENRAPETYVFVQGPVDTVSHRVHLYWYGTDSDGEVEAYTWRWVYPPPAPQDPPWDTVVCVKSEAIDCGALKSLKKVPRLLGSDTAWVEILRLPQVIGIADSVFTMLTGSSDVVSPRFEIRAIDNECACDTSAARQTFQLSNLAPVVQISSPLGLRDSTYASVTVTWETIDPDGGGPGLYYRIRLDGNGAQYDSTFERTFTVPSDRFLQDNTYKSGPRTLYIQAVDDGGRSGPWASMTWYVRAPAAVLDGQNRGQLLVVDEVPSNGANNALLDAFYQGVADLVQPPGSYSVLRPQFNRHIFQSARDVAQTLRQFQAVLWYRGGEITISPWLSTYQDEIGEWLDAGGKLYLDGLYLVQGLHTPGALREDFVPRHLGSTRLLYCYATFGGMMQDSTAGWSFHAGSRFHSSVYGEAASALVAPLRMNDSTGAVRAFAVTDTSYVALWAMDGQLDPPNTGFEAPVGVTVPQAMNGRIVLVSLPLRFVSPAQAGNVLRRALYGLGVNIPPP